MNFVVYKSSAGSGKTTTLVKEYLGIVLLNPERFRQILAITFTNKSANEMKERIVKALLMLSANPVNWTKSEHELARVALQNGLDERTISLRASQVLSKILHHYSYFAVLTIDSFMQRVIRSFAQDLDLPQQYEVELDTEQLRKRVIDRIIDKVGHDQELTEFLLHYAISLAEDDRDWNIENELYKISETLFREKESSVIRHLSDTHYNDYVDADNYMRSWAEKFSQKLGDMGRKALELISNNGLTVSDLSNGSKGIGGFYEKLASGDFEKAAAGNKFVIKAIETGEWTAASASSSLKQQVRQIQPALQQVYEKASKALDQDYPVFRLYQLISANLYATAVLGEIAKMLIQVREEERIIPISEFNHIVSKITLTEPAPYIYERIGNRFRHFMVDEFQDTSVLQWANILPLIDNSLANNSLNLIVGDAKQAIYRWRNGEVGQFIALPKLYQYLTDFDLQREQSLLRHYIKHKLICNHRSHRHIVEFNNLFFSFLADKLTPQIQEVYHEVIQGFLPEKSHGYVEISFLDKADKEAQLRRIVDIINKLRNDGCAWGDLALLCRTNIECSLVARHLIGQGYPVISAESLLIGFSEKVRTVAGFMKLALSPEKSTTTCLELIGLLSAQGFFPGAAFYELVELFVNGFLNNAPKDNSTSCLDWFASLIKRYGLEIKSSQWKNLQVYEMCEVIKAQLGYNSSDIYLSFLTDAIHKTFHLKATPADEFAAWWDEKGKQISVVFPENMDAIRVLTIHKSKGLQFPVVIFPFANLEADISKTYGWIKLGNTLPGKISVAYLPIASLGNTPFKQVREEEYNKTLLDLVNLAYVAFTRPEQQLYILCNSVSDKTLSKHNLPTFLLQFIHSLEPEFRENVFSYGVYSDFISTKKPLREAAQNTVCVDYNQPKMQWKERLVLATSDISLVASGKDDLQRKIGVLLHRLLARSASPEQLSHYFGQVIQSQGLDDYIIEKAAKMVGILINDPVLNEVYSCKGQVINEADILLPDGSLYRPDRLIINNEACYVFEFKTGSPEPEHETQVNHYMKLMESMGFVNPAGRIVYITENGCNIKYIS